MKLKRSNICSSVELHISDCSKALEYMKNCKLVVYKISNEVYCTYKLKGFTTFAENAILIIKKPLSVLEVNNLLNLIDDIPFEAPYTVR